MKSRSKEGYLIWKAMVFNTLKRRKEIWWTVWWMILRFAHVIWLQWSFTNFGPFFGLVNILCGNGLSRPIVISTVFLFLIFRVTRLKFRATLLRPWTRSHCYHGNKSAATLKMGIFVHPPECLATCKIWRGVENFHFLRCLILAETCSWLLCYLFKLEENF